MKFSCPECQAKYQVDLPATGEEGVEVKCARCQHTFRVFEETASALSAGSASNTQNTDSLLDSEPDSFNVPPESEENLDAFLDELIQQEKIEGSTDVPADLPETATPDTNLDGLLENLLAESPEETGSGLGDEELDQIWNESVEEGREEDLAETQADESLQDIAAGEEEAIAEETPPALEEPVEPEEPQMEPVAEEPTTTPDGESSEEDLWAQAFADQAATEAQQVQEESLESGGEEEASEEDLWAQAFADQEATEAQQAQEESPESGGEEEASEEDLWAQAFADQEATEAQQAQGEATEEADGEEESSEEDLWAQAFADQEATEAKQVQEEVPKAGGDEASEEDLWAQAFEETGEAAPTDETTAEVEEEKGAAEPGDEDDENIPDEELEKLSAIAHEDSGGLGLADEALANYNEEDYADFDDDEDFETEAPSKKLGFIPLPSGKTGKLIVGGGVVALLLIAGSAYFAIQTFAPPELVEDAQVAESAAGQAGEAAAPQGDNPAEPTADPGQAPNAEQTGEEASAVEQAQNALLGEEPGAGENEKSAAGSEDLQTALQPYADIVEMSSIMPVAYSPTDIKVLSFTIHLEMDQPKTAEGMRNSLPVYEKIMVNTVENFLKRKFYNDILYVKEKLVKRLELEINKKLKQGKIKKAKFKEFQIS